MKATVKKSFRDKITKVMYKPGESVEMDDARIADLAGRGLVEPVKEKKAEEPEEKPKAKKKSVKKSKK